MSAKAVKPNPPSAEGESHRHIDREIREMVSALTTRLSDLQRVHRAGASGPHTGDEDEQGVSIITLAGTNTGATMRGDMDRHHKQHDQHEVSPDEDQPDGSDTYVNSNFQTVNNSIMLGSTYTSNDPGVHMDIEDVMDNQGHRVEKHGRRGVRKGKEPAQGNQQQSEFSE